MEKPSTWEVIARGVFVDGEFTDQREHHLV